MRKKTPAIFSFCFADIPYVLAAWQKLSQSSQAPIIIYSSEALLGKILFLNEAEQLQIPASSFIHFTRSALDSHKYECFYLFTMGTVEIINMILFATSNGIKVFYRDCYFPSQYQRMRLIDPLAHFLSPYRSSLCPSKTVLKQAVRQLIADPLRRTMYFSGDAHCWPTQSLFAKLDQISLNPLRLTTLLDFPSHSLLFTLNSTENSIPIDWDYFKLLGYSLFHKPHPLPSSDYAFYPDFVKPIASEVDPSQVFFDNTSFLVSFYSFTLASTKQSISLANLYLRSIHPLLRLYRDNATYVPSTIYELDAILS